MCAFFALSELSPNLLRVMVLLSSFRSRTSTIPCLHQQSTALCVKFYQW